MVNLTTIGFIRHGVTAWNKEGRAQGSSDIPLDQDGIEMAKQVAIRLADEQWDIIYTSPLQRAAKTAEIIAENIPGIKLVKDERLREKAGGHVEGTTEQERIEKWGEEWRELDMDIEAGKDIVSRGLNFIEEMKRLYPNKRVLAVSHGGFIKKIIKEILQDKDVTAGFDNTSVTVVNLENDKNDCTVFNCTKHLQK